MSRPVSWDSCSRTCLAGFGLVLYASLRVSSCFAVIVVRGLLLGWSPSMLPPSANSEIEVNRSRSTIFDRFGSIERRFDQRLASSLSPHIFNMVFNRGIGRYAVLLFNSFRNYFRVEQKDCRLTKSVPRCSEGRNRIRGRGIVLVRMTSGGKSKGHVKLLSPTFRFRLLVIGLADKLPIFHEIKLVAGVQLPGAKGARETRQVIDQLLRPTYHLRRCQPLAAARAFRPETPATPTTYNIFTLHSHINGKIIRLLLMIRDDNSCISDFSI